MKNPFIGLKENPVYLLESREGNPSRKEGILNGPWFRYLSLGFIVLILLLTLHNNLLYTTYNQYNRRMSENHGLFYLSWSLLSFYLVFRALGASASSIAGDRERGFYQSLISTSLSPETIVTGKFWVVFLPLAKEFSLIFPLLFLSGLGTEIPALSLLFIYPSQLMGIAFAVLVGLFASCKSKSVTKASSGVVVYFLIAWTVRAFVVFMLFSFSTVLLASVDGIAELNMNPILVMGSLLLVYNFLITTVLVFVMSKLLVREISRVPGA